jgi:hypothetical protein
VLSAAAGIMQVAHDVAHQLQRQLRKCRLGLAQVRPQDQRSLALLFKRREEEQRVGIEPGEGSMGRARSYAKVCAHAGSVVVERLESLT